LLNRKSYPVSEYVEAILITGFVTLFTLSERNSPSDHESNDSSFGVMLLAVYLACDSFTSQWQSKVYKSYGIDQYQMMLGVNIWSMIMTGFTLYQSGDFFSSFAFILADPTALLHMVVLSITSATGQLFIFYTIKEFGPVVFTIMMTIRQIFSLFISLLLFGHSMGATGWFSIAGVFIVVGNRIYRKGSD
jgi:solute carrier family 35 (adenosine 3'-phospho 5'-phosphosulfate transporter), member B2